MTILLVNTAFCLTPLKALRLTDFNRFCVLGLHRVTNVCLDDLLKEVLLHILRQAIAWHDGGVDPTANVRPLVGIWDLF